MLFAASVKINFGKNQRRISVLIEAEDMESAKVKAIKQARKIYAPGKKANYTILEIINEQDAYQTVTRHNANDIIDNVAEPVNPETIIDELASTNGLPN